MNRTVVLVAVVIVSRTLLNMVGRGAMECSRCSRTPPTVWAMSKSGPNGVGVESGSQAPLRSRIACSSLLINRSTSVVLPIPASPPTRTVFPSPRLARLKASDSCWSSPARSRRSPPPCDRASIVECSIDPTTCDYNCAVGTSRCSFEQFGRAMSGERYYRDSPTETRLSRHAKRQRRREQAPPHLTRRAQPVPDTPRGACVLSTSDAEAGHQEN